MSKNNMEDHTNILLLKAFRQRYGFTQTELAGYLNTTRGQIAMAENLNRPLSQESEALFLLLQQQLELIDQQAGSTKTESDLQPANPPPVTGRTADLAYNCRRRINAMLRQKMLIEKELPGLLKSCESASRLIADWERRQTVIPDGTSLAIQPQLIIERSKQKLLNCDEVVQLTKQLQLKILSAGVDVLTGFLQEHGL